MIPLNFFIKCSLLDELYRTIWFQYKFEVYLKGIVHQIEVYLKGIVHQIEVYLKETVPQIEVYLKGIVPQIEVYLKGIVHKVWSLSERDCSPSLKLIWKRLFALHFDLLFFIYMTFLKNEIVLNLVEWYCNLIFKLVHNPFQ